MNFTLLMSAHPDPACGFGHRTALGFANALLEAAHTLDAVFFYMDAVLVAAKVCEVPTGARWMHATGAGDAWLSLASRAGCTLFICSGSATRHELDCSHFPDGFTAAGLGELVQLQRTGRLVHFR